MTLDQAVKIIMTATKQSFFSKAEQARRLISNRADSLVKYNQAWNQKYDELYQRPVGYVKQDNIS